MEHPDMGLVLMVMSMGIMMWVAGAVTQNVERKVSDPWSWIILVVSFVSSGTIFWLSYWASIRMSGEC